LSVKNVSAIPWHKQTMVLWKESLNSDGKHQYQQNEQPPLLYTLMSVCTDQYDEQRNCSHHTCRPSITYISNILSYPTSSPLSAMVSFRFVEFNATFNNISVISWRSVLLVEETRVPGENNRPVSSHWQTLSHKVVSRTHRHERGSNSQR